MLVDALLLEPSATMSCDSDATSEDPAFLLRVFLAGRGVDVCSAFNEEALDKLSVLEETPVLSLVVRVVVVRDLVVDFVLAFALIEEVAGVSSRSELYGLLSITEG
jgi:hypothetical protein